MLLLRLLGVLVALPALTAVFLYESAKTIGTGISEFTAPYVEP
jgi:hypothetical protein